VQFSVIIPTRNRPHYLIQAVESVMTQENVGLEILLVDDGNIELPAFADDRVKILSNTQRGAVAARNLGVAGARGDCIAFLDDDDWWTEPNFLSRSHDMLMHGSDFTFADGTMVFDDGRQDVAFAFDANQLSLETDNSILISTVCYRRSLHAKLGAFDEALPYYWDWDWYLRVARGGYVLTRMALPMVAIRVHDGNMSSEAQEKARRVNLDALTRKHGLAPLTLKNHLSLASEWHSNP
jgi:glycosyltransferase involved in cell wall biosynthesis